MQRTTTKGWERGWRERKTQLFEQLAVYVCVCVRVRASACARACARVQRRVGQRTIDFFRQPKFILVSFSLSLHAPRHLRIAVAGRE